MPFVSSENCLEPDSSLTVWRYMDFDKFESIIRDKSLFFCRVDKFQDPFEGSVPRREAEFRMIEQRRITDFYGDEFDENRAKENIKALSDHHRVMKMTHIMNCWHLNESESYLMWRSYSSRKKAIAIKTTLKKLLLALERAEETIFCSKVRYIDFEKDIWSSAEFPRNAYNFFIPLLHKRIEFINENELRLIHEINFDNYISPEDYWKNQKYLEGLKISVDVNALIEMVYLSPFCKINLLNKVNKLIKENGYNIEIVKSNLTKEPFY